MTMIWGTNGPPLDGVKVDNITFETEYYHQPIHDACFAMPRRVAERMNKTM